MTSSTDTRRLTLVVGAGRSGTSTVAGVLRRLGLHVPGPEVTTDPTNPKGFAEPQWVVDFHDDLLRQARVEVSDARPEAWVHAAAVGRDAEVADRLREWLAEQLTDADHLLVKDPRLLWFIPLWTTTARELGVEPSFVTMLRPPAEVVGSKRASYNRCLDDAHGVASWLNLMLGTERATRGADRAFVRYHDLLDDWVATTDHLAANLGLVLDLDRARSTREIDRFVDPGLRRVRLTWSDLDLPAAVAEQARETWTLLDRLAESGSPADPGTVERLDLVHAAHAHGYRQAEATVRSSLRAVRRESAQPAPDAPGVRESVRLLGAALTRRLRPVVTQQSAARPPRFTHAP
ncbi:sulfotransferase [Nocardioides sp. CN2-186]|uniref:sulfotransferase family protein n=1 Tax=Nocardioides tweenelious TaxID=3156607 RepID=UPI0032B5C91E